MLWMSKSAIFRRTATAISAGKCSSVRTFKRRPLGAGFPPIADPRQFPPGRRLHNPVPFGRGPADGSCLWPRPPPSRNNPGPSPQSARLASECLPDKQRGRVIHCEIPPLGNGFDAPPPLCKRSEEHTSELQSRFGTSYTLFSLTHT